MLGAMAKSFQAPPGTRDFYPQDLLRRRYIEKLWRDTSIRHGFEEIDGPTFEHADLYAVKSGEGILNELFQTFSGKDPEQAKLAGEGRAPYALRPEFTPTLARMYAAKAGSLPKPCRWFWMQNCYRAERQQRGRLREFGQWNCDVIGGENPTLLDVDTISVLADLFELSGLTIPSGAVRVRIEVNDRRCVTRVGSNLGIPVNKHHVWLSLLDMAEKSDIDILTQDAVKLGVPQERLEDFKLFLQERAEARVPVITNYGLMPFMPSSWGMIELDAFRDEADKRGLLDLIHFRPSLARGLEYYTGVVFEARMSFSDHRAIAGGGRYDNLIELFGGPPTPAVGFGMGDVVLSLVLQDKGLLPEGPALLDALSRPHASYRPDAFIISNGSEDAEKALRPLLAALRRGVESEAYTAREGRKPWDLDRYDSASRGVAPLHARTSSKATKNIGKLIKDAIDQGSRFAVVLESGEEATLQNLATQEKTRVKIGEVGREIATRR